MVATPSFVECLFHREFSFRGRPMIRCRGLILAGLFGVLLPCLAVPADEPLPLSEPATFRGTPLARDLMRVIAEEMKKGPNDQWAVRRIRGTAVVLAHHVG